jgi:beta-aspartyl-peptidase (threonine type)
MSADVTKAALGRRVLAANSSAIIVHGGAGTVTEDRHAWLREGCRRAAEAGDAILIAGGSALDAVTAAVRVLEDDPEYNAGTGSALTRDGTVETDAAIMEGHTQRVGAVAAVPNLGNAIVLARAILDANEHAILAGSAAWAFAAEVGVIAPAAPGSLITERARARLAAHLASKTTKQTSGGTVGAVARDHRGHFAAATSTGGIVGKRPGRVGDSPIPGAGTWADSTCALSATGDGEAILRVALARTIAARAPLASSAGLRRTAIEALRELARITGQTAGVIGVDAHGVIGLQLTPTMPIASILRRDTVVVSDSMGEQIA